MYYTVDQEVTHQVWADMSLWQEHSLPPSPTTPQSRSRTHLSALCYNNPITMAVSMSPSSISMSQQPQQQPVGPLQAPVPANCARIPHTQDTSHLDSWPNYVPQEPVTFDDTLRDCIDMLSGRKPALNIEIPVATSNGLVIALSQSPPISTPIPTPSTSPSSYQSATETTSPLPDHHTQHMTPQGIYPLPPSYPPQQHQQLLLQSKRVKGGTWPQHQEAMVDPDATPRRQKPRYNDDEYSPKWVRYSGHLKEGFCDTCTEGRWLQLKNSAYWYHKQFYHGISSVSGKRFAEPLEQRLSSDGVIEGLCHQCGYHVAICNGKRKRNNILWYKHAHKCHIYNKPEKFNPSYRMF